MRNRKSPHMQLAVSAALLALTVSACDKPAPQVTPEPMTQPVPDPAAQPTPTPAPDPATPETPPPASSPSPGPDAPPPTEPSAVPKPTSAPTSKEPNVDTMLAAIPSSKMGVAVDLKYSFDGEVLPNQPVMVHLAALPRVEGGSMKVSVQNTAGLQMTTGNALTVQKADASGVYRQQFSMTRVAAQPAPLRVLVTMQMGEDTAFGYFTIPLPGDGTNPQKSESVKLH